VSLSLSLFFLPFFLIVVLVLIFFFLSFLFFFLLFLSLYPVPCYCSGKSASVSFFAPNPPAGTISGYSCTFTPASTMVATRRLLEVATAFSFDTAASPCVSTVLVNGGFVFISVFLFLFGFFLFMMSFAMTLLLSSHSLTER
jgi:hypothetical protein